MGSTGEKLNGLCGDKREGGGGGEIARKRERNRLKGRESRFAVTGNVAWAADGCGAHGLKRPRRCSGECLGRPPAARHRGTPRPLPSPRDKSGGRVEGGTLLQCLGLLSYWEGWGRRRAEPSQGPAPAGSEAGGTSSKCNFR